MCVFLMTPDGLAPLNLLMGCEVKKQAVLKETFALSRQSDPVLSREGHSWGQSSLSMQGRTGGSLNGQTHASLLLCTGRTHELFCRGLSIHMPLFPANPLLLAPFLPLSKLLMFPSNAPSSPLPLHIHTDTHLV